MQLTLHVSVRSRFRSYCSISCMAEVVSTFLSFKAENERADFPVQTRDGPLRNLAGAAVTRRLRAMGIRDKRQPCAKENQCAKTRSFLTFWES
jgi:hypothetical protein